jgi:hypothetical protein
MKPNDPVPHALSPSNAHRNAAHILDLLRGLELRMRKPPASSTTPPAGSSTKESKDSDLAGRS